MQDQNVFSIVYTIKILTSISPKRDVLYPKNDLNVYDVINKS